jgi:hypothetical protein
MRGMATVNLRIRPKWWFAPPFYAAAVVCALTSLVSERAAEWFGDKLCHLLARFAFRIEGYVD